MLNKDAHAKMPPWVVTFADLMSLLLGFFVLLYSFSEMDKEKYKQVAGSMREAFGVQQEIRVKDPPKGINIVAREFSPGIPDPTVENQVRQLTTSDSLPYPLLSKSEEAKISAARKANEPTPAELADKARLTKALQPVVDAGLVELATEDHRIVVRIKEKGTFPSGSDRLEHAFEPIVRQLGDTLIATGGTIVIAGYTDSIPIESAVFRSNWDLSMARALSVARVFFERSVTLGRRTHLEAYADLQPIDTNETPEGRARNRRVEVSLIYPGGPSDLDQGGAFAPKDSKGIGPDSSRAPSPPPSEPVVDRQKPGFLR